MGSKCDSNEVYTLSLTMNTNNWENLTKIAVRSANLLSKLALNLNTSNPLTVLLIYSLVRTHIEIDELVYGSAVALNDDYFELFSPYAFKKGGEIVVTDLAFAYNYSGNNTEWYFKPKTKYYNATLIKVNMLDLNPENATSFYEPQISLSQGHWTQPYYDCGGGNIWMVTYSSPILFLYKENIKFGGVVTIDINLSNVDINQCDMEIDKDPSTMIDNFRGSHHCELTTHCKPMQGKGFRRGSYYCYCNDGYYYPNVSAEVKAFTGFEIEDKLEKHPNINKSDIKEIFSCIKCSEGCNTCSDNSACMVTYRPFIYVTILIFVIVSIIATFFWMIIIHLYKEVKVIKSASPIFLNLMCVGMIIMSLEGVLGFFKPNCLICTIKVWSYNIGFFLSFSALLLKTWRISMVFKIKTAKAFSLPDKLLLAKVTYIIIPLLVYLIIWTIQHPPKEIMKINSAGLKFFSCDINIWDYILLGSRSIFLLWGIYLCFQVRKAPSSFNESKFINLAIYNTICLSNFIFIIRVFIALESDPMLLYILEMIDIQIEVTITQILIFYPKLHLIITGKGNETNRGNEALTIYPTTIFYTEVKIKAELNSLDLCEECKRKLNFQPEETG